MTIAIQVKRTSTNNNPPSLMPGELAWVNASKKFVVGGTDGNIYPVGGDGVITNYRLDQFVAPTSPLNLGGQRITNLPTTGLLDTDAAPVSLVKSLVKGLVTKDSVRAASSGTNIPLSTPGAMVDGVTPTVGDRVLLKNQTNPAENGIYIYNGPAVALTRAPDFDYANAGTIESGAHTFVEQGTVNGGSSWNLTNPDPIASGSALTWTQFSGGGMYTASAPIQFTGSQIGLMVSPNTLGISGTNQLEIKGGSTGQFLVSGGPSAEAMFGALDLASTTEAIVGILPIARGGTGASVLPIGLLKVTASGIAMAVPDVDYLTPTSVVDGGTY